MVDIVYSLWIGEYFTYPAGQRIAMRLFDIEDLTDDDIVTYPRCEACGKEIDHRAYFTDETDDEPEGLYYHDLCTHELACDDPQHNNFFFACIEKYYGNYPNLKAKLQAHYK